VPRRKLPRLGFNFAVGKSAAITTLLKKKKSGPKHSQSRSSASHATVDPASGTSGILAVEEEDAMASPESQQPEVTAQPDDQIVHRTKPRVTVDTRLLQAHFRRAGKPPSTSLLGGVPPPNLLLLSGNTAVSSTFARQGDRYTKKMFCSTGTTHALPEIRVEQVTECKAQLW
jgi:hypothetical protein